MAGSIAGISVPNHSLVTEGLRQQETKDQQTEVKRNQASGNVSTPDKLSLTGTAEKLRNLELSLSSQSTVDSKRVESIRNELNMGSFQVNPERVAQKMIEIEGLIDQRLG